MSTKRTPWRVRCGACSHVWIALYLPMPALDAAKVMKALHCPKCSAGADQIFASDVSTSPIGSTYESRLR